MVLLKNSPDLLDHLITEKVNLYDKFYGPFKDRSGNFPCVETARYQSGKLKEKWQCLRFGLAVFSQNINLVNKFLLCKDFLLSKADVKKCEFFISTSICQRR